MKAGIWSIAVGGIILLAGCGEKTPPPEIVRPVVTTTVEKPLPTIERTFSGIAQGEVDSSLSFRVGGEIRSLPARIGLRVSEGDDIARLDPTDYEIQLEQARAVLAQARAQFVKADADYTRTKALYENDSVSKSALDASQAGYDSAKAQMDASEKQMNQAEQQLAYTVLRAPQDGTIGEVPVEINQVVQPGQIVATLVSEDKIEIEIGIPETLIARIKVGDRAILKFDSIDGEEFPAVVSKVGIDVAATSTYPVQLSMTGQDSRIRPGMVGEATVIFERPPSERLITVPPAAVAGRLDERYVWVYQSGNVTKRTVTVGNLNSNGLQIKDGVSPGEVIVTRGVHRLEEGMKVTLLESAPF